MFIPSDQRRTRCLDLLKATSFLLNLSCRGMEATPFLFLITNIHLPEPKRPGDLRKWHQGRG